VLRLLLPIVLLFVTGCESLGYYSQLAEGQWSIWWQRQAIDKLLNDSSVEPALRARLQKVQLIRQYAVDALSLPDNNSYKYFADVKRPFVVWNVFAAEEFSVEAKRWCFPVAGCVSYRGYFTHKAARDYADSLAAQGYDTYVAGIRAYSTLGWFGDPVLNTFVYQDEARLAGLIFHELAHQILYLPGDTEFNESFATAVELAGLKRWLQHNEVFRVDADDINSSSDSRKITDTGRITEKYLRKQAIHRDFVKMILVARKQLDTLYRQKTSGDFDMTVVREEKHNIIQQLVGDEYVDFKAKWGNYEGYDRWFYDSRTTPAAINNAKLSTVYSYQKWVPSFQSILTSCDGDLPCFYAEAKKLSLLNDAQRLQRLQDFSPSL